MNKKITSILLSLFISNSVVQTAVAGSGAVGNLDISLPSTRYHNILPTPSYGQNNASYSVAIRFVRNSGLHKSLSLLLLDSVKAEKVVESAISRYGFSNVKSSVVLNIKNTSSQYRNDWDGLLASIYSSQFGPEVLQSILDKGENSPYFTKFIAQQSRMNTSNLLSNSTLFKEARANLIAKLQNSFSS